MRTLDYDWTPETVAEARFGLYEFLADPTRAAELWALELHAAERAFYVPAELDGRSHADAARWLAQARAEQVGQARLYLLDDGAGDLATHAGARLRDRGVRGGGAPPSPYGLLLSPAGLGFSDDGMEMVAASWAPHDQGWWVTWWADIRDYLRVMGVPREGWGNAMGKLGPLHYMTSGVMLNLGGEPASGEEWVQGWSTEGGDLDKVLQDEAGLRAQAATLIGAWQLLTHGAQAGLAEVTRVAPPAEIAERERAAGVIPSKITCGRAA